MKKAENTRNRIDELRKYLADEPSDPFLKYALGLEYIKAGNTVEAETVFREVHKEHPEYLANYYQYASVLFTYGKADEAVKIVREGMELSAEKNDPGTRAELEALMESNLL